jgi:pilus assembly protein CpaE
MKQSRRILLAGAGEELRRLLDRASGELPQVTVEVAPDADPQALNGKAVACDALVVEVDLQSSASTEVFLRLAGSASEGKLIAAARNARPEDVRRLFRAGAADVLTAPFTPAALEAALHDVLDAGARSGPAGRVVSVLRANGGAGATTVALNLAALFARADRKVRRDHKSVAVLDLDLQFGDADLALNLEPRSTLVDVLRAEQRFDGRLLQSAMIEHSSGIRLLAAPPKLVPLDALSASFAARIVTQSAQLHDYTFVDLPHVWSDWTLSVLRASSLVILLAPPTVQGAVGARRALDALEDAAVATPTLFVLNKLAGVVDAFEKPSRIGKSLNRAVDTVLALDPTAPRAFDRGVLLTDAFPNARLTRELRTLATKLEAALAAAEQRQLEQTGAAA